MFEGYDDLIEEELEKMGDVFDDGEDLDLFVYEELYFTKTLQDKIDYLNETRLEALEALYWKWNL